MSQGLVLLLAGSFRSPPCLAPPNAKHAFRAPPRRPPADFQAIIQAAEGQPTVLDCSADGTCYVAISGFYIPKLAAACTTAECLVNGYSLQTGAGWTDSRKNVCALAPHAAAAAHSDLSSLPQAAMPCQRRRATMF